MAAAEDCLSAERLKAKLNARLLPLLGAGYALSFMDRAAVSFAQTSDMPLQLNLTKTDYGLCVAAFFGPYALLQLPIVAMLPKFGPRKILATSLTLWGVASTLSGLVKTKAQLISTRALLGVFEAGFFPGSIYVISRFYPAGQTSLPSGVLTASGAVGYTVGAITSGFILDGLQGSWGLSGWRWLFILQGFPAVLLGLVLLASIPDSPQTAHWLSNAEREFISSNDNNIDRPLLRSESDHLSKSDSRQNIDVPQHMQRSCAQIEITKATWSGQPLTFSGSLSRLLRWETSILGLQHFVQAMVNYLYVYFLPVQLEAILPPSKHVYIGIVSAAPIPFQFLTMILASRWVDSAKVMYTQPRRCFKCIWGGVFASATSLTGAGIMMLLSAASNSSRPDDRVSLLAVGLIILCALFLASSMGPFWTLHHIRTPCSFRAHSIAAVNALGNVGGFVGPYLRGYFSAVLGPPCPSEFPQCISKWGWGTIILGASCLLTSLLVGALGRRVLLRAQCLVERDSTGLASPLATPSESSLS